MIRIYVSGLNLILTKPSIAIHPRTLSHTTHILPSSHRITMPPYGAEFKNFFSKSDSEVFQRLAKLMQIVESVGVGQQQALERK